MKPGTVVEKLGKFDVLLGRGIGPNGVSFNSTACNSWFLLLDV